MQSEPYVRLANFIKGEGKDSNVSSTNLSARSRNSLLRNGIRLISELREISYSDLNDFRNFGQGSLEEVLNCFITLDPPPTSVEFVEELTEQQKFLTLCQGRKLSNRSRNILVANNLDSLARLSKISLNLLSSLPGIGENSYLEIVDVLGDVIGSSPHMAGQIPHEATLSTDELHSIGITVRDLQVLHARIVEGKTLDQIGSELSRTRELVRQVEREALKKVHTLDCYHLLTSYIETHFPDLDFFRFQDVEAPDNLDIAKEDWFSPFKLLEILGFVQPVIFANLESWWVIDRTGVGDFQETSLLIDQLENFVRETLSGIDECELEIEEWNKSGFAQVIKELGISFNTSGIEFLPSFERELVAAELANYSASRFGRRGPLSKPCVPGTLRYSKRIQASRELLSTKLLIDSAWIENSTLSIEEFCQKLEIERAQLRMLISPWRLTILQGNGDNSVPNLQQWTDEQCLEALRTAATYFHPLRAKQYSKICEIGEIEGPSVPLLYNRFGSWSRACELAGVESGVAHREYESRWSATDLEKFVDDFMLDPEVRIKNFSNFDNWLSATDEMCPSSATIRNRLGNWSSIKAASVQRIGKA